MTFRQPLIYRWRQQKPRLTVHLAKIAHPPTAHGAPTKQPYPHYGLTPPKSDRLLVRPKPLPRDGRRRPRRGHVSEPAELGKRAWARRSLERQPVGLSGL